MEDGKSLHLIYIKISCGDMEQNKYKREIAVEVLLHFSSIEGNHSNQREWGVFLFVFFFFFEVVLNSTHSFNVVYFYPIKHKWGVIFMVKAYEVVFFIFIGDRFLFIYLFYFNHSIPSKMQRFPERHNWMRNP